MFRPLRRARQALDAETCVRILQSRTWGVLAVAGDNGYPYAVPLNHLFRDGKLFFHCARSGHKLDAIAQSPKVSFCVVDADQYVPHEFTTHFRSVVVFGRARVLEDASERRRAIEAIADRFSPDEPTEHRDRAIDQSWGSLCVVCVDVDHISGKEAIELVQQEKPQV